MSELHPLQGRKGLGLRLHKLTQGRNADLANDVMEMVFSRLTCSLSLTARSGKSLCYPLLRLCGKVKGAMSRTVTIICIVSQLITNYPCIIAVCGDKLNIGTYPDPSSSSNERSGLRVPKTHQATVMVFSSC